jgi:eukaryotic-like serine/threonine-protein kinase
MGVSASPLVVGRYAIYGKIAQGGMAAVHFGRLQGGAGFSRTVAIKRLHSHLAEEPEFLSTMIDEARLAARIHHPNVVPTLDVVSEGGELLVVMEYVRGDALSRLLRAEVARQRRVPLPIASAIMLGALHGLHAAHEAKSDRGTPLHIVHRDVSPQNILVGVDGVARIIDFGVAKAAGRLQTTREGVIKGKVAYMAQEQLAALDVTRLVDVYAMGVVLWETLAGRNLFKAPSEAALVLQVMRGATDPPSKYTPNLPSGLDELVMRALSIDPAARFASAREMADALVRVVPPSLPTDVGAWVEELARETLTERATVLAEIESASGIASVHPSEVAAPGTRHVEPTAVAADDLPTVASQPSSLSLEAPAIGVAPRVPPSRRAWLVGVLGAAILVGTGIVAMLARGGAVPGGEQAASAQAPSASEEPIASQSAAPATSTPAGTAMAVAPVPQSAEPSVATTAAPASAPPTRRPPPATRRRSAPAASSGMVRFAQPD